MQLEDELNDYIDEVLKGPNPPSIHIENTWITNSKNFYHARIMNQRHYNGEAYQMQIDAHHIFVKDWDTKCIEMLHSCDAGEYSILS